jgi:hypothetical protein
MPPPSSPTGRLFSCGAWSTSKATIETSEDLDKWLNARNGKGTPAADDPEQVVETVKLPYLNGLQYGYLTALEDTYRFMRSESGQDPDKEIPSTWSTLLVPNPGMSWLNLMGAIPLFAGILTTPRRTWQNR